MATMHPTALYSTDAPKPSLFSPCGMQLSGEHFDPSTHLQIEPPSHIKDLNFCNVRYPFTSGHEKITGNLAYTKPFRVLSDEGVLAARRSIEKHASELGKTNSRASNYIRGLGYVSNWHREFAYSPELVKTLSSLARDNLCPHTMTMNISHTNVGKIGTGRAVDKWHTDSVDYVMVLILSDLTDIQGGELEVLQQGDATGSTFRMLQEQGVPSDLVEAVKYTGPGYAILMQGSRILHRVKAVLEAREPRISLVNSYMTCRPFAQDLTKYHTFTSKGFNDGDHIAPVEFSRHKAWRISGQMKYILDEVQFGTDAKELAQIFRNASRELLLSAELLENKRDDNAKWVEDKENNLLHKQSERQLPMLTSRL